MKRELEALLFATDSPLNLSRLKKIFADVEASDIKAAVKELQEEYEQGGNAFDVVEFGGGWQIATRPEYAPLVEKLLVDPDSTVRATAALALVSLTPQDIGELMLDQAQFATG